MKPEGELVGALWRIVFFRAGDRIAHRVELVADGGYEPVLESAEGSPDEPWPASPALQQVHFQPGPDGRQTALLVGMAGRSHWSASVEVSGNGSQATFEVACRAKSPPAWLGTSYRVLGQGAVEDCATGVVVGPLVLTSASPTSPASPGRKPGDSPAQTSNLPAEGGSGEPIEPAPPPQWAIGQVLRLTVLPPDDKWPQTISWRYVLQVRR